MTTLNKNDTITLTFQTEEEKQLYKEFYLAALTGILSNTATKDSDTPYQDAKSLTAKADLFAMYALCHYHITLEHPAEETLDY